MSDVNFRFGKSTNKIFRSSTFGTACNPGDVILATDTGDLYIASPDTSTTATNYGKLIHINKDNISTLAACSNWYYNPRTITYDDFLDELYSEFPKLYLGDNFDLIVQAKDEDGNLLYKLPDGTSTTDSKVGNNIYLPPYPDPNKSYHCEIIGFNLISERLAQYPSSDDEFNKLYGTRTKQHYPIVTLRITCKGEKSSWLKSLSSETNSVQQCYYSTSTIREAVNLRAAKVQYLLHGPAGSGRGAQLSHYAVHEPYTAPITDETPLGYTTIRDPANLFCSSHIYTGNPFQSILMPVTSSYGIDTFPAFIVGDGSNMRVSSEGWLRDCVKPDVHLNQVCFINDYRVCEITSDPTASKTFATYHHIGLGNLEADGSYFEGNSLYPGEIKIDAAYGGNLFD